MALGLAVFWPGALFAAEGDSAFRAAVDSISTVELKTHVDYLADDAREGRQPDTQGGREAGDYVARQFQQDGLSPGAEDGYFQPFPPGGRNVLALLRGSDPRRHELIVVGAHYDHVGYGNRRNSRGPTGSIHNGADDNASGTAGLVELAEAFSKLPSPPARSILFAAFDAEEMGMLGSKYWVAHPTVAREKVVFLVNLDMIGRLRQNRLMVLGSRSGFGLRRFLAEHNHGFKIDFVWTTKPNADHWPFFDENIPVLTLNTGLHDEYHTPSDDANLINAEGMRRVVRMIFESLYDLADAERMPDFRETARHETDETEQERFAVARPRSRWHGVHQSVSAPFENRVVPAGAGSPASPVDSSPRDGKPLRWGISWRVDPAEPGTVVLVRVMPGSPSERAGLRPGDRIYRVAGKDFADHQEFAQRVRTLPSPLELLRERNGQLREVTLHVEDESTTAAGALGPVPLAAGH